MPEWLDLQAAATTFMLLYVVPGGIWMWAKAGKAMQTMFTDEKRP